MNFLGRKKKNQTILRKISEFSRREKNQPRPPVVTAPLPTGERRGLGYQVTHMLLDKNEFKGTNVWLKFLGGKQLRIDFTHSKGKDQYRDIKYDSIARIELDLQKAHLLLFIKKGPQAASDPQREERKFQEITLVLNRDCLRPAGSRKSIEERLMEEQLTVFRLPEPREPELKPDDDEALKFGSLTKKDLVELERCRKTLSGYKDEEKVQVMVDYMRLRPEYDHLRCPVLGCSKQFKQGVLLRKHMRAHPELGRFRVEVGEDGNWQIPGEAIDFVMCFAKMYPENTKKIIKLIKTRRD